MDNSEDDKCSKTLPVTVETAHNFTFNLLPIQSREKYDRQYELFGSLLNNNNVNKIYEHILLVYFSEKVSLKISHSLEQMLNVKYSG